MSLSTLNRHRLEQQLRREQATQQQVFENQLARLPADLETQIEKGLQTNGASFEHAFARTPESHLLFGRAASREQLIHALQTAEKHLLFVCPWLSKFAIDSVLMHHLQSALKRKVTIDIGWGRLRDLETGEYKSSVYYNALPQLELLARKDPRLQLKPIGTHEKILVCDRTFAMIGTHNFLPSDERSQAREVSLRTKDQNVIHQLLQSFEGVALNDGERYASQEAAMETGRIFVYFSLEPEVANEWLASQNWGGSF